jgi:hypothetical protein
VPGQILGQDQQRHALTFNPDHLQGAGHREELLIGCDGVNSEQVHPHHVFRQLSTIGWRRTDEQNGGAII